MSSIEEWINWFEKNYGFLQEKYAEKFVAISENKVIASGSSYKEVHSESTDLRFSSELPRSKELGVYKHEWCYM